MLKIKSLDGNVRHLLKTSTSLSGLVVADNGHDSCYGETVLSK